MPAAAGHHIALQIEKPAAGGWMIARHEGQVVLVSGAIPGETVTARVERVRKGVVYATAASIDDPSPDRRPAFTDPLCGGCLYGHIAYPRQIEIKGQVIADAFARIGKLPLARPVAVAASPEQGYRMRARLHLRDGQIGFFREGTHELCDARATRQLLPETCDALDRLAAAMRSLGTCSVREVDVSENVAASERAVSLEQAAPAEVRPLLGLAPADGLTGLAVGGQAAGDPHVTDVLTVAGTRVALRRHVLSFFQGNRYLLGDLAAHVADAVPQGSSAIDLYAGVGLFSVAIAAGRGARVTAVEGDRAAALDLAVNARGSGAAIETVHLAVESFVARQPRRPDVLIVDPPRTGMSRDAVDGALALRARQMIYVSCDVATLARDARRFVDAGYMLAGVQAFDLFPNTPHVETVVDFRM